MATNEELEKSIQELREQVNSLQDGFEKFQRLLLDVVETKQLKVDEAAQVAGRDIGQTLYDIGQKLNSHEATLSSHDTNIATAQNTANSAVNAASAAQNTANSAVEAASAAQGTANSAVNAASAAQGTANSAVSLANTAQSIAPRVQTLENKTQKITFDGKRTVINSPLTVNVAASSSQIIAILINVGSFGTPANARNSFYLLAKDLGSSETKEIKP